MELLTSWLLWVYCNISRDIRLCVNSAGSTPELGKAPTRLARPVYNHNLSKASVYKEQVTIVEMKRHSTATIVGIRDGPSVPNSSTTPLSFFNLRCERYRFNQPILISLHIIFCCKS